MSDIKEQEIIERIEKLIDRLNKKFQENHEFDAAGNERICGMLDVLEMITGKSYWYDEHGVHIK